MLSVLVYGRNDNHGYNMHKRIAISLNAIAEVLTHENDEILYVDYNTSNDLPTVIEAIQDTLTDKTKKLLRVFRVRPEVHERFIHKTHAQVNEPLARNVAIRRSNPKNKWILSTNTDMVFTILDEDKSLSDIVSKVEEGFYELARFDVPEPLWESLDRKDPKNVISKFREWGKTLHLNEVVYGNETIIYDAPGDFQLMLRDDIFKINGFDERMIWGWHVDSNLCKRMKILHGKIKSLQHELYGYHCNHTRMSGWMHMVKRKENSIKDFFQEVEKSTLEKQEKWGLKDEKVEEIKIGSDATTSFADKMEKMLEPMKEEFNESYYNAKGYDRINYSSNHISTYLFEQFLNLRPNSNIMYVGYNQETFDKILRFAKDTKNINEIFYNQILPSEKSLKNNESAAEKIKGFSLKSKVAQKLPFEDIGNKIDLLILDFGVDNSTMREFSDIEFIREMLHKQNLLVIKISCQNSEKTTKVVNINIHNTRYYRNVKKFLSPIQNPYSSGIMVGRILNNKNLLIKFYNSELVKKFERMVSFVNPMLLTIISPIVLL